MSEKQFSRWGTIVDRAFTSVVFVIGLLPTLMMVAMTPWYRGETDYCTPPDHAGPCDRIQEMSTGGATLLAVAAFALWGAGFVALIYGWRLTLDQRLVRGTVIALAAALGPAAAYGVIAYGYSPV
ncbi:hypothetical protein ABGB14_47215 [Nonomuraea sp. B10E15]|uniref:hypothetical protein n=1 Tax=Nonomuraea sp. B10E15 TaxID=3153560 RepID=UPI00325EF104